jgi:hypothetical protein
MTTIDTDISSYTLTELMTIINLDDLDPTKITENTNTYIEKFKNSDPKLSTFFKDIQSQLLQYYQGLEDSNNKNDAIYPVGEKQVDDIYENEYLKQPNQNEVNKITQRKQKIKIFGDGHVPMTREQLGVSDNYNVPVRQDSLNPNLKNTINRFVNLDSQFRQYSGVDSISTNYTLDLSDRLNNTLSLNLYSYQIPNTWYVIDSAYNNTCFWINFGSYNIPITISPGNYSPKDLVTELNNVFNVAGFTFTDPINNPASYNSKNGKLTLKLYGGSYNNNFEGVDLSFNIDTKTKVIFFDFTATLICNTNCINNSHYFNQSLGWVMGFRVPYLYVDINGNTGAAVVDLNGTKYLILVIDDYNQNRVNNGLVTITELSSTLKKPNYYSPDLPYTCLEPGNSNLTEIVNSANVNSLLNAQGSNTSDGLLIAGKYNNDYSKTQLLLPSAPRTLTQSQIYTINEINKNNNNITNYRAKAPTNSDIMAIIPLKGINDSTGTLLIDFSGSLQDNERTFFGPVNIDRMAIKLLDDKGNILNLNGADWCVTLIATCLYQY